MATSPMRSSTILLSSISREAIINNSGEQFKTQKNHVKEQDLVNRFIETLKGTKPNLDFFTFFYELVRHLLLKISLASFLSRNKIYLIILISWNHKRQNTKMNYRNANMISFMCFSNCFCRRG